MHRLATADDHSRIIEIERAAGELFRGIGMTDVADDPPISRIAYERFVVDGGAVVWTADAQIVAYLLLEELDGAAHVEQVTVHPGHARAGIGAQLLAAAGSWAAERGLHAVTLTTFRDVPWNAPYYRRLGFSVFPRAEWGPSLRARMGTEAARGLDAWPRVAMIGPTTSRVRA